MAGWQWQSLTWRWAHSMMLLLKGRMWSFSTGVKERSRDENTAISILPISLFHFENWLQLSWKPRNAFRSLMCQNLEHISMAQWRVHNGQPTDTCEVQFWKDWLLLVLDLQSLQLTCTNLQDAVFYSIGNNLCLDSGDSKIILLLDSIPVQYMDFCQKGYWFWIAFCSGDSKAGARDVRSHFKMGTLQAKKLPLYSFCVL